MQQLGGRHEHEERHSVCDQTETVDIFVLVVPQPGTYWFTNVQWCSDVVYWWLKIDLAIL